MGLLSSLFGDKKPDNPVLGALADLVDSAVDAAKTAASGSTEEKSAAPAPVPAPQPQQAAPVSDAPSGESWGAVMPSEENQFSFSGSYGDYFMKVYREEFPEYSVEYEDIDHGRAGVITFSQGGQPCLKVELLSQSSGAYSLRQKCRKSGMPYLRFYYDHDGWWNTRSYIVKRARTALGG